MVFGGGVGISLTSPIRICMDKTEFAMPEAKIGFYPDVGASYFLTRIKNNICLGLYLGITGLSIKGDDLLSWGFATHYMKEEDLDEFRGEIMEKVTDLS